jgi:hypothetical protein
MAASADDTITPRRLRCGTYLTKAGSFELHGSPSLQGADHDDHQSDHQQDVNKSSQGVTGHQSQKPQNQQDQSNRPQHLTLSFRELLAFRRLRRNANYIRPVASQSRLHR